MTKKNDLLSIQYLRALAAIMVIFHHFCAPSPWLFNPVTSSSFGAAGITLFFVISGFVMFSFSRDMKFGEFIRRRLVRIVPLYWIATLVFIIKIYAMNLDADIGWQRMFFSFFFVPYFEAGTGVTHPTPLLHTGWTLDYEIFFYAAFALCLLTKRLVTSLSILMGALVTLGLIFTPQQAIPITYTDALMLEFLIGVIIGKLFHAFSFRALTFCLPIGLITLLICSLLHPASEELPFTIAAVLTLIGALAFEHRHKVPQWDILKFLGDASYSIYLTHLLVLYEFLALCQFLPLAGWLQFLIVAVLCVSACVLCGVYVHVVIERPVIKFFNWLTLSTPKRVR